MSTVLRVLSRPKKDRIAIKLDGNCVAKSVFVRAGSGSNKLFDIIHPRNFKENLPNSDFSNDNFAFSTTL